MIEQSSIESLKNSLDIIDVVGSFIELKKAGANYKANCPFHGEKTPSFVVSPTKQIYHCFGCGVGGDSIKFIMELEKLNYPEAIEKLASMYNFSLSYTKGKGDYSETTRVLKEIQKWYIKNLDLNQESKKYLYDRGISSASIEEFEIGFVSHSSAVLQFLNAHVLPMGKAHDAGVIALDEQSNPYARLVNRITFPIYSSNGAIVGFGGRTTTNHPAKYINSPQTKLFNKSRILYGYHRAKKTIYEKKRLVVCEGYLDVVMFHQAGFKESVATLGTALTPEHLPLLKKGEPKIILAYDGDKAGVAAAYKASILLTDNGFDGGVVLFGDSQDPADMIANGNSVEVDRMLREPKPLIVFILESIANSYDLKDPKAKENAFFQMKQYLSTLSQILSDSYISIASSILGISPNLFIQNSITPPPLQNIVQQKDDIVQLSIMKTLLENTNLIDSILDVVPSSIFGRYSALFDMIARDDIDNPMLMGLQLDESFEVMNQKELKATLINIILKEYLMDIQKITNNHSIDYKTRSFIIRKIRTDMIPRLKKGELIAYENKINY